MRRAARAIAFALLLAGAAAPAASAQDEQPEVTGPAEERATEFRAVEGPVTEDVPGGALMVGAYGVIWLLVLLYVVRLGRMQGRIAADVERLERSLASTDDQEE